MTTAGQLTQRFICQARSHEPDGWGSDLASSGVFVTKFDINAHVMPLRGNETVVAARLDGVQPFIVRVRRTLFTLQIKHDWRLIDARDEKRILYITSPLSDPDGRRQWLEFMAKQGGI